MLGKFWDGILLFWSYQMHIELDNYIYTYINR